MPEPSSTLLSVQNLHISFNAHHRSVEAVRGISFDLKKNHTLAIVGESGSGKSVTALSLTRLLPTPPTCIVTGSIRYKDKDILKLPNRELRKIRGKEIAYIFQEPSTSLNPVFTVGYQIAEAIKLHLPDVKNVNEKVVEALDQVGIKDPKKRASAYPHELSGGMQQRVMIAMALACEPQILVADEPTTALDVTIQKQIMDLLQTLKKERDMSIILITHNFGIVSDFADESIVMFQGNIVEQGPTQDILHAPKQSYTKALIECIPKLGAQCRRLKTIDYSKL